MLEWEASRCKHQSDYKHDILESHTTWIYAQLPPKARLLRWSLGMQSLHCSHHFMWLATIDYQKPQSVLSALSCLPKMCLPSSTKNMMCCHRNKNVPVPTSVPWEGWLCKFCRENLQLGSFILLPSNLLVIFSTIHSAMIIHLRKWHNTGKQWKCLFQFFTMPTSHHMFFNAWINGEHLSVYTANTLIHLLSWYYPPKEKLMTNEIHLKNFHLSN